MNDQRKRHIEQSLQWFQVRKFLSLWRWGGPYSEHIDMFTSPEPLWTLHFRDFNGGFIINSVSSPLPFMEDGGCGEKVKLLLTVWFFWEPTSILKLSWNLSRVTSLELKTPVTWKTPRVLGALYQELGSESNMCIFCHFTMVWWNEEEHLERKFWKWGEREDNWQTEVHPEHWWTDWV